MPWVVYWVPGVEVGLLMVGNDLAHLGRGADAAVTIGSNLGGFLLGFTGGAAGGALQAGFWTVLVAAASWLIGRRPRLRLAAFDQAADGRATVRAPIGRLMRWFAREWWKKALLAQVALLFVELIAELGEPRLWGGRGVFTALRLAGTFVLLQAGGVTFAVALALAALSPLVVLEERLRRVARALRARRRAPEAELGSLQTGRTPLCGTLRPTGAEARCIAPLSGRPCLGFRLVGRVGIAIIDDAEVGDLVVQGEDFEASLPAGRRVVLSIEPPPEHTRRLDEAQRARVARFLEQRELPLAEDLELGEALLLEGDEITIHAAIGEEAPASTGYRTASRRRVIDQSDGRPVLVTRTPRTTSR